MCTVLDRFFPHCPQFPKPFRLAPQHSRQKSLRFVCFYESKLKESVSWLYNLTQAAKRVILFTHACTPRDFCISMTGNRKCEMASLKSTDLHGSWVTLTTPCINIYPPGFQHSSSVTIWLVAQSWLYEVERSPRLVVKQPCNYLTIRWHSVASGAK